MGPSLSCCLPRVEKSEGSCFLPGCLLFPAPLGHPLIQKSVFLEMKQASQRFPNANGKFTWAPQLSWIWGRFSHWCWWEAPLRTTALSGSGDGHRGGGERSGARGLPLPNLERGPGLKDRSYREGGRGQRTVINSQGLGAHLSPHGFWLAPCHLFLWLKCRLHSFLSQASRLPSLLRHRHSGWLCGNTWLREGPIPKAQEEALECCSLTAHCSFPLPSLMNH